MCRFCEEFMFSLLRKYCQPTMSFMNTFAEISIEVSQGLTQWSGREKIVFSLRNSKYKKQEIVNMQDPINLGLSILRWVVFVVLIFICLHTTISISNSKIWRGPVKLNWGGCQCKIVIVAAPKLALTINQLCRQFHPINFVFLSNLFVFLFIRPICISIK